MVIKAMGWLVIGYLFGILGFAFAEFGETLGEMDLASASIHSLSEGVKWPGTFYDLITGDTTRHSN